MPMSEATRKARSGPMHGLVLSSHVLVTAAGAWGLLVEPSPVVVEIVGYNPARILWSVILLLFGGISVWARQVANMQIESVCMMAIGTAFVMFGVFIFLTGGVNTGQSGIAFLAFGLHCFGWAAAIRWWSSREYARFVEFVRSLPLTEEPK